eukprot:750183-Hanusia_phi.AAC.1
MSKSRIALGELQEQRTRKPEDSIEGWGGSFETNDHGGVLNIPVLGPRRGRRERGRILWSSSDG